MKEFYQIPEKNYGFFIYPASDDGANSVPSRSYAASEAATDTIRPKLTIQYDDSDGIITSYSINHLLKGIKIIRGTEEIKFYIPFEEIYSVSMFRINGKKTVSLEGSDKRWYKISTKEFSNGLLIINVKVNGNIYSKKILWVK